MLDDCENDQLLAKRIQSSWRPVRENLARQADAFSRIEHPDSEGIFLESLIQSVDKFMECGYDKLTRVAIFLH